MRCYPTLRSMSSRNHLAQELHEQTTTHARDIYPATHRITDCTQLPQQSRKTPPQNPFAHYQHLVTVSDDVSWQVKIGLHHFLVI